MNYRKLYYTYGPSGYWLLVTLKKIEGKDMVNFSNFGGTFINLPATNVFFNYTSHKGTGYHSFSFGFEVGNAMVEISREEILFYPDKAKGDHFTHYFEKQDEVFKLINRIKEANG